MRIVLAIGVGLLVCASVFGAEPEPKVDQAKIDQVVVFKSKRKLILLSDKKEVRSYRVALGGNPVGPKTRQGDHRTPEGMYVLDFRNVHSQFYKSLHVSYPNAEDRAAAKRLGVSPGGDIMIHGLPNGSGLVGKAHSRVDWTDGCIAVSNEEMDEIWDLVPDGTPVEIKP